LSDMYITLFATQPQLT